VKAVWKKNPSEYTVFLEDGEYKLVHDDKLFKEETQLASHEVELALVDEFQKEINSGINLGDNLKKLVNINC
jgi:hypothetical protein